MQEIKFRAWSKLIKKYVPIWSAIETRGDDVLRSINNTFVIEQYTGLKDKNGVEIYEGDIVAEITQFDDDEPDLYEVIYNETGDYPAFDLKGWTGEVNGISELSLTYGIEVVGNIHENVDLLVDDIERMIPDDIGNDIHEFLHEGAIMMYRVKNITSETWVKEYIVGKWLKETIEPEDAGIFDKKNAQRLARMLSDEDVKYRAVQLPVEDE